MWIYNNLISNKWYIHSFHYLYFSFLLTRHKFTINLLRSVMYHYILWDHLVSIITYFPNFFCLEKDFLLTKYYYITGLTSHTKVIRPYSFCWYFNDRKIKAELYLEDLIWLCPIKLNLLTILLVATSKLVGLSWLV